jgi:5-methyltetrahydrofolate--homocysteine methyltransferase
MKMDFLERLKYDVLVQFAPIHTLLADWGKDLESHLSHWIIKHPEAYQEALQTSYEAGCDIGTTATQAASPWRAESFGLRDKVYDFNYQSARLAKAVTPKRLFVCGQVSTTNPDFLEPIGKLTHDEVYEGYKAQISALLDGGSDIIFIAGNHIAEGVIAVRVAKDLSPTTPVIGHNVFYATKHGFRTMMGLDPMKASAEYEQAGVDIIGANCGLMTKSLTPGDWCPAATSLVREIRQGCTRPLSIMPDPGVPQLIDSKTVWPITPVEMAREIPNWIEAGARMVGGCCGTSLEHYQQIALEVKKWRLSQKATGKD